MSFKFKLELTCEDDNYNDYPDYLIYEITKETFQKWIFLKQIIKENHVELLLSTSDFDNNRPILYYANGDGDITEAEKDKNDSFKLYMSKNTFYIEVLFRYEDIYIQTIKIEYAYLEQLFTFSMLPIEHMAKHINHIDENIRNIAKERLANNT